MTEQILSISFKDTIADSNNTQGLIAAGDNLARQILAAAEKIKSNPAAVYSFMQLTGAVRNPDTVMKPTDTVTLPAAPKILKDPTTVDGITDMLTLIFENLKRTEKSVKIVSVFVQNSGADLTVDRLVTDTGLNKNDLSSWLAQTGKKIKAITNPSRGVYKFDPDKV